MQDKKQRTPQRRPVAEGTFIKRGVEEILQSFGIATYMIRDGKKVPLRLSPNAEERHELGIGEMGKDDSEEFKDEMALRELGITLYTTKGKRRYLQPLRQLANEELFDYTLGISARKVTVLRRYAKDPRVTLEDKVGHFLDYLHDATLGLAGLGGARTEPEANAMLAKRMDDRFCYRFIDDVAKNTPVIDICDKGNLDDIRFAAKRLRKSKFPSDRERFSYYFNLLVNMYPREEPVYKRR